MGAKTTLAVRRIFCSASLALLLIGCGAGREETIGGVAIPIPAGMKRTEGQGIALSLPGFGGENASFQGNLNEERVVDFYEKEMPSRGWKPAMGIISRGGMLAYTKEGTTVLLGIGKTDGATSLSVTVGGGRS
jgi:hypothetical protein